MTVLFKFYPIPENNICDEVNLLFYYGLSFYYAKALRTRGE